MNGAGSGGGGFVIDMATVVLIAVVLSVLIGIGAWFMFRK